MVERLRILAHGTRSVRVRITAVATAVVAVAILLAGWGLVRAVEDQLVDKVHTSATARIDQVAAQLVSGIAPTSVALPGPGAGAAFVQVLGSDGRPIAGPPLPFGTGDVMLLRANISPGDSGGVVVQAPVSGEMAAAVPLDVRYEAVGTPSGTFTVLAASPLDGVEESISTLKRVLMIGLPFVVAMVGTIAWFVTGRALRPVDLMRAEVDAITAKTIDRRLPEPGSRDELGRLAHTMNSMLDRLESASVRQRQFISDASHELRSPVATMRTELEVGLRAGPDADWPMIANDLLAEEQRLESLIGDLLLLAAVDEDGNGSRPLRSVDIGDVAREEAARTRTIPVTVRASDPAPVRGVPDQLARVLGNLLDNAVRFAASEVNVDVSSHDGSVMVTVDDDGPGIPPADRERAFERFTRLDGSRSRPGGGAGLGLALARAIIERHHGSISVTDAPSGGARFEVRLPAMQ